jgi:pSer/pThr/pTyr-binding forkhead associated (FHA) protein
MMLKLIVLAGAKEGLEIPLKKDKFLIGRAKECALRAGSEAISRRHCAIIHRESGYTVRDLGSRNGTHVNGEKITAEVPLKDSDELRVGPLTFRVATAESKQAISSASPESATPKSDKPRKQPPVKNVADVVERTISNSDSATEEDVSRWLLNMAGGDVADTLKETRSMRAEETSTMMNRVSVTGDTSTIEDVSEVTNGAAADDSAAAEGEEEGSGVWKFLKRGKPPGPKKKEPGKLPPREEQKSKDSRDAAADILREMQRRR